MQILIFQAVNYFTLFPRPVDYFQLDERFVDYSTPFPSTSMLPFQIIADKTTYHQKSKSLMDLIEFLIPSFGFVLLTLACLFFYFLFLILSRLANEPRTAKKQKILSFFLMIFLFFIATLFNCNLNTSNIVVDVSDLLFSLEKVLTTDRKSSFEQVKLIEF